MSATKPYKSFNYRFVKPVVFDEAAAMFRADGLLVFGNTPRPMLLVGEEKQLAPTLMTTMDKTPFGDPVSRFTSEARISWLS